jgi:hypothetical protein
MRAAAQNQGLIELGDALRLAQLRCETRMLRLQRRLLRWFLRKLLDLVVGYGEVWLRALVWYLLVIVTFSFVYLHWSGLNSIQAITLSITSFHGRGLSQITNLNDMTGLLSALEALIGLVVEAAVVASFARRVLGE